MDRSAGKTYFVQKKHLKTPKIMDNFLDRLTLEGAGGQTGDTRSTFKDVQNKSNSHNFRNWASPSKSLLPMAIVMGRSDLSGQAQV